MIEPEVAFADLASNMKLAEDCLKSILRYVLASCDEDLEFLENREIKPRNSCRRTNATMRRCALVAGSRGYAIPARHLHRGH